MNQSSTRMFLNLFLIAMVLVEPMAGGGGCCCFFNFCTASVGQMSIASSEEASVPKKAACAKCLAKLRQTDSKGPELDSSNCRCGDLLHATMAIEIGWKPDLRMIPLGDAIAGTDTYRPADRTCESVSSRLGAQNERFGWLARACIRRI